MYVICNVHTCTFSSTCRVSIPISCTCTHMCIQYATYVHVGVSRYINVHYIIIISIIIINHNYIFLWKKDIEGKRPCPVCRQLRTAENKTPDDQIHRVLGRTNAIWCPYANTTPASKKNSRKKRKRKTKLIGENPMRLKEIKRK